MAEEGERATITAPPKIETDTFADIGIVFIKGMNSERKKTATPVSENVQTTRQMVIHAMLFNLLLSSFK